MEKRIIEIARSWIGTKFHHQGRVKGEGVDCIGLIVGVARELGIKVSDRTDYTREPRNGELEKALLEYLQPCELKPGAVALFRIDKAPQHVGIISHQLSFSRSTRESIDPRITNFIWPEDDNFTLIHAYAQARKVVEHGFDEFWKARLIGCYEFIIDFY